MSRDKVDSLVITGAVVVCAVVAYVSYQSAESRITSDCLKMQQFQVNGRVYNCYVDDDGGEE